MITDILDLEQLLAQYESEAILVGPILSLSINASYRYFYLAGNSRNVYQSIGLAFLENELHAQKQRADIIEKLKSRFAELVLFDTHAEMARAVHTRWPTEETARVLAAAEREAKAASAPQADYETMSEQGAEHTLPDAQSGGVAHEPREHPQSTRPVNQASPSDDASVAEEQRQITLNQGGQLAAEPAAGLTFEDQFRQLAGTHFDDRWSKPADIMAELHGSARLSLNHPYTKGPGCNDGNDNEPSKDPNQITGNLKRELFEDTGRPGTIRLPSAATLPPLTKACGEAPARQNQRHLGLTRDNIASAILKRAAPAQPDNCPISPIESSRGLRESPATLEAEQTLALSDSVPILPSKHARARSTFLLLAIVLFSTFVLPSTRQGVDKADNTQLAQVTNLPSKSAAAEPPVPMSPSANAIGSAQQAEAAPRTVPPAAAASRVESSGSDAALLSDRHEPVVQQERTADLSEANAIAKPVDRGMESVKSGDLESAQVSLQRAVEVPGTAAVPSQVEPSRSMPLREKSQALAVQQPGPQNERSRQIKSLSDARQSAQVPGLEPGVSPGSGQVAPAQKDSTIRHLDPDEIAILLSRGMDFLNSGDFASARVTLRRAAEAGNAEAALALGTTYDPSILRQLGAVGIAADVAEARKWYENAVNFGSAAAAQKLARLAQPTR